MNYRIMYNKRIFSKKLPKYLLGVTIAMEKEIKRDYYMDQLIRKIVMCL